MKFRPNHRLAADLKRDPDFTDGLRDVAESAREHADQIARAAGAPWMPKGGNQQAVVIETDEDGVHLVLTGHGAHLVEFGSQNNPPHAPLRRGVSAAGLGLSEADQ